MRSTAADDRHPTLRVQDIDLAVVAEALGDGDGDTSWWFDPATGQVEMFVADWVELEEDADDPSERGLVLIEPHGSRAAYRDMVEFAESVAEARASDLLVRSLEGRGAFSRFRDTLYEFPELREQWLLSSRASSERRAIDWLVDGSYVEPTDGETERAGRAETVATVLATIGSRSMVEVDHADIPARWQDIGEAIDSGHTITVLRDGQTWAVISPHSPGRRG